MVKPRFTRVRKHRRKKPVNDGDTNVVKHKRRISGNVFKKIMIPKLISKDYQIGKKIKSVDDLYDHIKDMKKFDRETFVVFGLNTKNGIIYGEVVSVGTLDASFIHPREIFKKAILNSASSIIVVHNHPSGNAEPSGEDLQVKKALDSAGNVLGIKLLDFAIIGGNKIKSVDD